LPCGREADLSFYEEGSRQDAAPVLDDGIVTATFPERMIRGEAEGRRCAAPRNDGLARRALALRGVIRMAKNVSSYES
jgi:hypothetical protein